MVVKLDPFTILKEVHWPDNRIEYLTSVAHFGTSDFTTDSSPININGILSTAPSDYTSIWTTSVTLNLFVDGITGISTLYDHINLFNQKGESRGSRSSGFTITKPTIPQTKTFGTFEKGLIFGGNVNVARTGPTADPLFPGYIALTDPVGAYAGYLFGASGTFAAAFPPDTRIAEYRQLIGYSDTIEQSMMMLPTGAVYDGANFTPIGVRPSGPFLLSGGFISVTLDVLFKRT